MTGSGRRRRPASGGVRWRGGARTQQADGGEARGAAPSAIEGLRSTLLGGVTRGVSRAYGSYSRAAEGYESLSRAAAEAVFLSAAAGGEEAREEEGTAREGGKGASPRDVAPGDAAAVPHAATSLSVVTEGD